MIISVNKADCPHSVIRNYIEDDLRDVLYPHWAVPRFRYLVFEDLIKFDNILYCYMLINKGTPLPGLEHRIANLKFVGSSIKYLSFIDRLKYKGHHTKIYWTPQVTYATDNLGSRWAPAEKVMFNDVWGTSIYIRHVVRKKDADIEKRLRKLNSHEAYDAYYDATGHHAELSPNDS